MSQLRIRTPVLGVALGFAMTLGFATAADATTCYLKDVTFDDGTSATGSFSTNVYGYLDGFDITTVDGAIPGFEYIFGGISGSSGPGSSNVTFNRPSYHGFLSLTAAGPIDGLTNGTLALIGTQECDSSAFPCPASDLRSIVSGSLSLAAAPEPAAWGLMVLGFGSIGFALRHTHARIAFAPAR